MVNKYLQALLRVDVRSKMKKSKTLLIDNLSDVEICSSKDAAKLHHVAAIDVADNFALVVLLVQDFLQTVEFAH